MGTEDISTVIDSYLKADNYGTEAIDSSLPYTLFIVEKEAKCSIPWLIWPFTFHSWVLAPPDQFGARILFSYAATPETI